MAASPLRHAGFVLAGGRSTRMGRDKATLLLDGIPLVQHVARQVAQAVETVTLVGPRDICSGLGFPVLPDLESGLGPLGGLATALSATQAEWNLVVACDMAAISPHPLRELIAVAQRSGALATAAAVHPEFPEPLCCVYHRSVGRILSEELLPAGERRARTLLRRLAAHSWPVPAGTLLQNLNTPEEWHEFINARPTIPALY